MYACLHRQEGKAVITPNVENLQKYQAKYKTSVTTRWL